MATSNHAKKSPMLSIIILNYNTAQMTAECIESVYTSCKALDPTEFEVIVFDNASKDDSSTVLSKYKNKHDNYVFMESKENIGFGPGNNRAVDKSQGEYILFLNSDIIVIDDAIPTLWKYYFENKKTVHFAGGKLLNKDKTPQSSGGPFYTLPVVFGALFLRGDYWGLTRSSPSQTQQLDWISGACIMTTKEIFNKVGRFDEEIFMYMEEIDLLYRARKQGYMTYVYPQAQFIHLGSASSQGKTYPILQVYRGFLYFYTKHYDKFSMMVLKGMLQLKALLAWSLGKLTGNTYLIQTYEKAYRMATMA
ncbi:MAG: glycosyltransferase family 2 protein [Weeksellaceae bacterium]